MGLQTVENSEQPTKIPIDTVWHAAWWSETLRQVPQFCEAVIAARAQLQQQIEEYIGTQGIVRPDFSKIQTPEELFKTGWRFHKTHWGILVPPGCPVSQLTVLIYCQLTGTSLKGWDVKAYSVTNPVPEIWDPISQQKIKEQVFVRAGILEWLKAQWNIQKNEEVKKTSQ